MWRLHQKLSSECRLCINVPEIEQVEGKAKSIEIKCYGNVLRSYREHAEAKCLGFDGPLCDSLTRGLLRHSHIVAVRHRYIGKETSRRWEHGDDLSIVDFKSTEYSDGKVTADQEKRSRIREFGVRKLARETGINRETVAIIANAKSTKANTLARVLAILRQLQPDKY